MRSVPENRKELLRIENLKKYFNISKNIFSSDRLNYAGGRSSVRAVDGVDLSIFKGETLGLVGESGCGKSTLARLILKLIDPDEGEIYFEGTRLSGLKKGELRFLRKRMQFVFQNPYASLNPRLTINSVLSEIVKVHGIPDKKTKAGISGLLEVVGLNSGDLDKYPHEFSGGQRQRIGIARALAVNPDFIVADEPVSSLDVSVQAQIINLFIELQREFSLTYLFIAHDLAVVRYISNRVAVMYKGRIVELAATSELYGSPLHPYTRMLLSSVPGISFNRDTAEKTQRTDTFSDREGALRGCRFRQRCSKVLPECEGHEPDMKEINSGHFVRCYNI